jgi:hypothetical protein
LAHPKGKLARRILAGDRRKQMKKLIASFASAALIATPALAAPAAKTATKPAAAATTKVATEAKSEGESKATEAKEHRSAARHHHASMCSGKYAKSHHKMAHKSVKKASKPTATTKS